MKLLRYIFCSFLFIVISFTTESISAQIILTPQNMALGGGGTAYLTGPQALFVNPANLRINEKKYGVSLSLLNGGIYYDELFPETYGLERFSRFFDINQFQTVNIDPRPLTNEITETLIKGNFGDRQQTKTVIHQADLHWFGIKWTRPNRSYAIAARTRLANKFEVGRGLFTTASFDDGTTISRNQFFSHTTQVLHEVSFGFGESFTYLNGQYPGLSEFMIGIAPKVIIPGSYQDVEYDRGYTLDPLGGNWRSTRSFRQISAGTFKETAGSIFSSPLSAFENLSAPLLSDLLRPQGFGFGLDAGITYLITFGDDLSILRNSKTPTEKSLRLSLSITDLGFVMFNNDALRYNSDTDNIALNQAPAVSGVIYEGIPNEHYYFLAQYNDFTDINVTEEIESGFKVSLPTSMQAGAAFQYNRFKAVADISYSIMKSAFTPPGLAIYTGLELRPVSFLPLRAGTKFAKDMPGYISAGAGLETAIADLNASVMVRNRGAGFENEVLALSTLALTFYF